MQLKNLFSVTLPKLAALLIFAWLLAWPGLPLPSCSMQSAGVHSCCARKKSSCGCESKSKPKLCSCKKRVPTEVAFTSSATPLALALHVCLVLDFLKVQRMLTRVVPTPRLYEARGPTEQGLTATQIALPPPA